MQQVLASTHLLPGLGSITACKGLPEASLVLDTQRPGTIS